MLVVHGLWTRAQTLVLWVEVPRRRPGTARPADLTALASLAPRATALADALSRPAGRTVTLLLPCTPAGRPAASTGRPREDLRLAPVEVDVVELPGARAVEVLAEVSAQQPPVSDGLRWIAHVAAGARAAVDAGHVVPNLVGDGERFTARWIPFPDRAFHRWRAAVAEACPPVLRAEPGPGRHDGPPAATAVLDDVCTLVVDVLTAERTERVRLHDVPEGPSVQGWIGALQRGNPSRTPGTCGHCHGGSASGTAAVTTPVTTSSCASWNPNRGRTFPRNWPTGSSTPASPTRSRT